MFRVISRNYLLYLFVFTNKNPAPHPRVEFPVSCDAFGNFDGQTETVAHNKRTAPG